MRIVIVLLIIGSAIILNEYLFEEKYDKRILVLETSAGKIHIELDYLNAPISCRNIESYVKEGFYEGTIIHRVSPGYVIQLGGYDKNRELKPTKNPIKLESSNGLKNYNMTVAMARAKDPNSATSQFFINLKDNSELDYPSFDGCGYTVFGKIVKGFDVIKEIESVETELIGIYKWPTQDIVVTKIYFIN